MMQHSCRITTPLMTMMHKRLHGLAQIRQDAGEASNPTAAISSLGMPWSISKKSEDCYELSSNNRWGHQYMLKSTIPFFHNFAFGVLGVLITLVWTLAIDTTMFLQV